ncbi:MAG: hypothetical protein U9R65_12555, partial [Pseudomonadota bacterium]|nr:hypothetical protein [Pseudomonadota bacterium]
MSFMRVLIGGINIYKLLFSNDFILVPGAGLEPARCYQRGILNHTIKNNIINNISLNFKI